MVEKSFDFNNPYTKPFVSVFFNGICKYKIEMSEICSKFKLQYVLANISKMPR